MTEKGESKQKFHSCVINKAGQYYKWLLMWGIICTIIGAAIVMAGWLCVTFIPIIAIALLSATESVPLWVLIVSGGGVCVVVIPIVVAAIVCWFKCKEEKIKKADEGFVCPE